MLRYVTLCYVMLRYVTLCYVMLRYVTLCYVMLRYVTLRCVTLCYVMLRYVTLCYFMLRYVTSCYVMLRYVTLYYVTLCYVMLRYVTLCYVMLRYVTLCYVMLRYVTLCYVMLRYVTLVTMFQFTECIHDFLLIIQSTYLLFALPVAVRQGHTLTRGDIYIIIICKMLPNHFWNRHAGSKHVLCNLKHLQHDASLTVYRLRSNPPPYSTITRVMTDVWYAIIITRGYNLPFVILLEF